MNDSSESRLHNENENDLEKKENTDRLRIALNRRLEKGIQFTGSVNKGNTCYLNSVVQLLFFILEF